MTVSPAESPLTLRKRAEEQTSLEESTSANKLSPEEIAQLIQELRVHQIELEMQNEELRRRQHELDAERARYFDLYELAPVGYLTLNEQGDILDANLTAASLLAVSRCLLLRQPFTRFIRKEDQDSYYLHRKKILESGEAQTCELRMVTLAGATFWADLKSCVTQDADGETVWRVVLNDSTDRKKSQETLRISEARYLSIIEDQAEMICRYLPDGKLSFVNGAYARYYNKSPDDLLNRNFIPDIPEPDLSLINSYLVRITQADPVVMFTNRIITPAGEERWQRWTQRGIFSTDGSLLEYQAVGFDITDHRRAENEIAQFNNKLELRVTERTAELERLNKELEEFCYAITHEFRAPLARMEGFSTIMREAAEKFDWEAVVHCSDRIDTASIRLRTVIDALLTLNRLSRADMVVSPVHLSEISRQIVAELLEQNSHRALTVTISPDIVVQGDRYMLEVCMNNLLRNALKYTSKTVNASIEFGKIDNEGADIYYVRDNGVGFDMGYAKNLFVPFCRLHTEAEFEGTGIGLATVNRIIEKHGGSIWAEAVSNGGATFYFTLKNIGSSK